MSPRINFWSKHYFFTQTVCETAWDENVSFFNLTIFLQKFLHFNFAQIWDFTLCYVPKTPNWKWRDKKPIRSFDAGKWRKSVWGETEDKLARKSTIVICSLSAHNKHEFSPASKDIWQKESGIRTFVISPPPHPLYSVHTLVQLCRQLLQQ